YGTTYSKQTIRNIGHMSFISMMDAKDIQNPAWQNTSSLSQVGEILACLWEQNIFWVRAWAARNGHLEALKVGTKYFLGSSSA
ncbi:MAG: hypothetical protein ACPL0A_00225, partial [Candidatus Micrarchaeia archaeon]